MQVFSQDTIQKLETLLKVKEKPWIYEKQLWEKVWKYLPYFSKIPGILSVCVCNSLAMNACHKDSDIDIFIITKSNRMWSVRIYTTFLFMILGQRKTHQKHAGKFCLSFFITENAMDFSKIAIKNDIYLSYWIQTLRPILNRKHTFEKFLETNFPEGQKRSSTSYEKLETLLPESKLKKIFWGNFEKLVKFIFLPRTQKSYQKLWKPFGVVISDDMLKFHNKDRRKEIRDTIFCELPPSQ